MPSFTQCAHRPSHSHSSQLSLHDNNSTSDNNNNYTYTDSCRRTLRLLDIRRIDLESYGWEVFYVKLAVADWMRDAHTNLGLLIQAKSMFNEPIDDHQLRFVSATQFHEQQQSENSDTQPLLVVYTHDGQRNSSRSRSLEPALDNHIYGYRLTDLLPETSGTPTWSYNKNHMKVALAAQPSYGATSVASGAHNLAHNKTSYSHQSAAQESERINQRTLREQHNNQVLFRCSRQMLELDFQLLNFTWILEPKKININQCTHCMTDFGEQTLRQTNANNDSQVVNDYATTPGSGNQASQFASILLQQSAMTEFEASSLSEFNEQEDIELNYCPRQQPTTASAFDNSGQFQQSLIYDTTSSYGNTKTEERATYGSLAHELRVLHSLDKQLAQSIDRLLTESSRSSQLIESIESSIQQHQSLHVSNGNNNMIDNKQYKEDEEDKEGKTSSSGSGSSVTNSMCCEPSQLGAVNLLYATGDSVIVLRQFDDVVATQCECSSLSTSVSSKQFLVG
ncbi:hypothetical protein GZH46_02849 [Fragariocoptes setiger]|uniref:TGF-beta propeptide domain-containing protein n=1 Tax=Fragariocoptes setiger TaxID=1670756 RepID=A0ABQ7S5F0_9ACAR|nr:hypothetical protein GZH46_02849 [Fragariocoptes setiger]